MATVKITDAVITAITGRVRELYDNDRAKIDMTIPEVPTAFGDYLYQHFMGREAQKKLKEALPSWYNIRPLKGCSIRIRKEGTTQWRNCPVIPVTFREEQLKFDQDIAMEELPGIRSITWNGACVCVVFKEDLADVPEKYKAFINTICAIPEAHAKVSAASKEAATLMADFLVQHTSLQAAMKAFGPALKHYFDPWIAAEFSRKPPPRKRVAKDKAEKKEVDISKLVAKAAVDKLNL